MKENNEIRAKCKEKNVKLWELAAYLKISESAFVRKMRFPVSEDMQQRLLTAIDEIASQRQPEREGW